MWNAQINDAVVAAAEFITDPDTATANFTRRFGLGATKGEKEIHTVSTR